MKKKFGQHFLFDKNILNKIVDCSGVTDEDMVIEIGPGLGTLTDILAGRAHEVIAIEFDRKLIRRLKENTASALNVTIIAADALKFDYSTVPQKFRVIANIPYYITTPLLFRLLEFRKRIISMTLLLQKEVAKRIVASPGNKEYGVLSITMQLFTQPDLKFTVSKRAFSPPPDVDSAVVHFTVSPVPLFDIHNVPLFTDIVKTAFSQRRKTIMNSLRKFQGIGDALEKADIDTKVRPEKMSIEDFARLTQVLS